MEKVIIVILVLLAAALVLLGLQYLWNTCVAPLGVPQVGYWQMWGIVIVGNAVCGASSTAGSRKE